MTNIKQKLRELEYYQEEVKQIDESEKGKSEINEKTNIKQNQKRR